MNTKIGTYFVGASDALWNRYAFPLGISAIVWIQGINDPICNVKEIHVSGDNLAIMIYDEYAVQNGIALSSAKIYFFEDIVDVVIT